MKDKSFVPLSKTGIDTGMGLERTTAAVQDVLYVYDTDLYAPIFERANEYTGISLGDSETTDRALRIVADHARGMAFLIADGVRPGNQRREYVLRRIIRRAMLQAHSRLGMSPGQLAGLAEVVVDYMGDFYEELRYGAGGHTPHRHRRGHEVRRDLRVGDVASGFRDRADAGRALPWRRGLHVARHVRIPCGGDAGGARREGSFAR